MLRDIPRVSSTMEGTMDCSVLQLVWRAGFTFTSISQSCTSGERGVVMVMREQQEMAHIQLSIQHEVKSKKVKIAQFVGQFVTDTLEAGGHNCLHATLHVQSGRI